MLWWLLSAQVVICLSAVSGRPYLLFNGLTYGVPTYSYSPHQVSHYQPDSSAARAPIGPQTKLQSDLQDSLLAALYSNIPYIITPVYSTLGYPLTTGGQWATSGGQWDTTGGQWPTTGDSPGSVEMRDTDYTTAFTNTGYGGYVASPQHISANGKQENQWDNPLLVKCGNIINNLLEFEPLSILRLLFLHHFFFVTIR